VWPDRAPEDTLTVVSPPTALPACGRAAPSGVGGPGGRGGSGAESAVLGARRPEGAPRAASREEAAGRPPAAPAPRGGSPASPSADTDRTWREPSPERAGAAPGPARRSTSVPAAGGSRGRTAPARTGAGGHGFGKPDPRQEDGTGEAAGPWAEPDGERGRHRRAERPPSGYTEFVPEPPHAFLERLSQRWSPHATLSRRSVLTLIVIGVLAVAAVLVLHERPTTVSAPEMVAQSASAPASGEPAGAGSAGAEPSDGPAPADAEADLVVHVGGEVAEPGLYTLPPGSRVADAVEEAGGALPEADLDLLNLARALVDGEQILVGVPPPPGTSVNGPPGSDGAAGAGALVDVNRADGALLETLPGVGPVIAENIIAYREAHGPFSSVDDLINVDRIGEKVLADLSPHATAG